MLVDEAIEALESQINDTAIIACSGGIDSSVAAVLAHRAVGSLLHCVYVDTGFMRKGETEEVREMFAEMDIELKVVDASERFFHHLEGVTDPEHKRKVIGEQFIRVFEEEQANCGAKFLVQGTIAPDWIESGGATKQAVCSIEGVELADPDMPIFREFTIKLPGDAAAAVAHMDDAGVLGGFALGEWWESMSNCLLIGCDERTSQTDIDALVAALSSWVSEVSA